MSSDYAVLGFLKVAKPIYCNFEGCYFQAGNWAMFKDHMEQFHGIVFDDVWRPVGALKGPETGVRVHPGRTPS